MKRLDREAERNVTKNLAKMSSDGANFLGYVGQVAYIAGKEDLDVTSTQVKLIALEYSLSESGFHYYPRVDEDKIFIGVEQHIHDELHERKSYQFDMPEVAKEAVELGFISPTGADFYFNLRDAIATDEKLIFHFDINA